MFLVSLMARPSSAGTKILLNEGRKHLTHSCFLIHVFNHFYQCGSWAGAMRGPRGGCGQFWNEISDAAYFRNHHNRATQNWAKMIPLGFHGDAGAFSRQDSLYTLSFNSPVGRGAAIQKRFVITTLRKNEMLPGTLDAALRVISWSFNVLLTGRTPVHSFNGLASAPPF